jgi:hypothetical protein
MKMLWVQNDGLVVRPRLEINEKLCEGDHVWIYGMRAEEFLFDIEKSPEPKMIPRGVRARVHALTREHFFLDTTSIEGDENGRIPMGMCGSVVMRNGKCVGMLTATVHEDSPCRELAGTAMCTYASDIFEFLLEVEKQMKNPPSASEKTETTFEKRRRAEGNRLTRDEHKDWAMDGFRLARHIECPLSLWHQGRDQQLMTDEDLVTSAMWGRGGIFNQETQETNLGFDMESSTSTGNERPSGTTMVDGKELDGKHVPAGERIDHSPVGVYGPPESFHFKGRDPWAENVRGDIADIVRSGSAESTAQIETLMKGFHNLRAAREAEVHKASAMDAMKAAGHDAGHWGPIGEETTDDSRQDGRDECTIGEKQRLKMQKALERAKRDKIYKEELRKRHQSNRLHDDEGSGFWAPH